MACLKTAPPTGEGGAGPPLPSEALGETESKALNAGQNIVSSTGPQPPSGCLMAKSFRSLSEARSGCHQDPDRASTR